MCKIYLDEASSTKPKQEVIDVIIEYLTSKWYNPSSLYSDAVKVKEDLNKAKKIVADFIGANAEEIYFTSSGSESNCWALQGFVSRTRNHTNNRPVIITSDIEHHSIMACTEELSNRYDVLVYHVGVDENGFIKLDELEELLEKCNQDWANILVSVMQANNEIGTIQNIKAVSDMVHKYNGTVHCDCTQSFGHIPIDVDFIGVDMLTASGHKINAPKGIGFLYKRNGVDINPIIFGSQMNNMRGGTENVPYIMGFAKAVELSKNTVQNRKRIELVRNYFIDKLVSIGCKLNGPEPSNTDKIYDNRLPNNINVVLPDGVGGEEVLYMLDTAGISVSTGSACNSMFKEPSYVLKAVGLTDEECMRSIRITFSEYISNEDIDKVVKEIDNCIRLLKEAD